MSLPDPATETLPLTPAGLRPDSPLLRQVRLTVVEGPTPGQTWDSHAPTASVGSHARNDLILEDPTISRFHCELVLEAATARVRDLGSRNGTVLDGVHVNDAFLRNGSLLQVGRASLRVDFAGTSATRLPISSRTRFGSLVATSVAMRASFALLERAAATEANVLLEGETGTGKSEAAEAIHDESARRDHPFVVLDCGAVPGNLLESELFGHVRGAYSGSAGARAGAFREADGGTVFLDEIGELPIELQQKLLRVVQKREVKPLGADAYLPVNVRLIAATNRDLRAEVNAARFRHDLFYRLAVLRIVLPPLRQRPEDIPFVVEHLLSTLGTSAELLEELRAPAFVANLQRGAWPGNVRELRNHLERCLVFRSPLLATEVRAAPESAEVDPSQPYQEAKQAALTAFERAYVEALVRHHDGKVALAARAAGMDRVYLYRLLRRHGLKP